MGGVRYRKLGDLAKSIWQGCEISKIHIRASYVPSAENIADRPSRYFSSDTEWEINNHFFANVEKFGLPSIVLFASATNTNSHSYQTSLCRIGCKCSFFVSWDAAAEGFLASVITYHSHSSLKSWGLYWPSLQANACRRHCS